MAIHGTITRYKTAGRAVVRRIGEDVLLVPVSGKTAHLNRVFPLNETGAAIWESLSRGRTLDETAGSLADAFKVDRAQAMKDSEAFAAELVDEGLLEPVVQAPRGNAEPAR